MSSGTKQFLIGCPNVSWGGKKYVLGADKELSVKKHKCIVRGLWGRQGGGIIRSAGGKFNKVFLTTLNQHTMGIVCKH